MGHGISMDEKAVTLPNNNINLKSGNRKSSKNQQNSSQENTSSNSNHISTPQDTSLDQVSETEKIAALSNSEDEPPNSIDFLQDKSPNENNFCKDAPEAKEKPAKRKFSLRRSNSKEHKKSQESQNTTVEKVKEIKNGTNNVKQKTSIIPRKISFNRSSNAVKPLPAGATTSIALGSGCNNNHFQTTSFQGNHNNEGNGNGMRQNVRRISLSMDQPTEKLDKQPLQQQQQKVPLFDKTEHNFQVSQNPNATGRGKSGSSRKNFRQYSGSISRESSAKSQNLSEDDVLGATKGDKDALKSTSRPESRKSSGRSLLNTIRRSRSVVGPENQECINNQENVTGSGSQEKILPEHEHQQGDEGQGPNNDVIQKKSEENNLTKSNNAEEKMAIAAKNLGAENSNFCTAKVRQKSIENEIDVQDLD